jgi:lipopolysaccharide/colanic/teichoic acid biosynthesis glycosyltransferase
MRLARRAIDILVSLLALVALSPLFGVAAAGIWLSSRGPIFYRAKRIGYRGKPFTMHKFRTMHVEQKAFFSLITPQNDPRVFPFGAWLRRLKIDELPQLFDILRGEMTFVGPRPEDPRMVEQHYGPQGMETLNVLPGLSSPGSIYYYTHGERMLSTADTEASYARELLPTKLALDLVYVREASMLYDLRVILRTLWVILARTLGKRSFRKPPEIDRAIELGLMPKSC